MILLFALALVQQIGTTKQPSVGQVLIATDKSRDPDLAQSVVLLIHLDSDGVMGLILNRPRGKSRFFGGPIALGTRALVSSRTKPPDAERILAGVYMVSKESSIPNARIYAGYVGWSVQQLTGEISRGLWKVANGDASIVFDPHPETQWKRAVLHALAPLPALTARVG
jgi:putative transcriptional regulator